MTLQTPPLPTAPAPGAPPHLAVPAAPTPAGQATPSLSPEHLRQLSDARLRGRKIGRAIAVARFDGWSIATFAFLTFLFGIGSASSMLMGVVMGVIAFIELRSAASLKRLKPEAARTLAFNQVALASLLIAYAVWRTYCELSGKGEYAEIAASDPQLGEMLKPVEHITRLFTLCLNGGIVAFALFAQGGMAAYYLSRVKHLRDYVEKTPAWVITVQQTGSYT